MMTRYSQLTCPKCGHKGKPKLVGEETGMLLSLIPIVGDISLAKDAMNRTLGCANCGEKLKNSLKDKAAKLRDRFVR